MSFFRSRVLTVSTTGLALAFSACGSSAPSAPINEGGGNWAVNSNGIMNLNTGTELYLKNTSPLEFYDILNGNLLIDNTTSWTDLSNGETYDANLDGYVDGFKSSATKDVNLQQTQVEQQAANSRAQSLADQFGMNFDAAQKLVLLSDRMQTLQTSGQLTDEDKARLADAALSVAGIASADVNQAIAAKLKSGDGSKIDALIEKGAENLGMSSSEALRTQILPSLGLVL